jgi:energy-converting hydrogenase Eha subunit G
VDLRISQSRPSVPSGDQVSKSHLWDLTVVVMTPLALLILIVIVTLFLTALTRSLVASDGFFVEQQATGLVAGAGIALAAVAYTLSIVRAIRKIKIWQQANNILWATRALWVLGITAITVALPLPLALLMR